MDMNDINDNGRYYRGFVFFPSIAEPFCKVGRKPCNADAAHCQGVGNRSYGTIFELDVV